MSRQAKNLLIVCATALGLSGCLSWFSAEISAGIGRLTMRNLGAIATLTATDSACGFASPAVKAAMRSEGNVGESGKITYRVEACRLSLAKEHEISHDCRGKSTVAQGTVTVTATQTIEGMLTGDPNEPIIPAGPDAATITFESIALDHFVAKDPDNGNWLEMHDGTISAVMKPRLATAESSGACAVITPNVTFSDVMYSGATMLLHTPDHDIEAEVQASALSAQSGRGPGGENAIAGTVTLWNSDETFSGDGDTDGLDPDYNASSYVAGYACAADIAWPERYDCSPAQAVGLGAARLTMQTLAALVQAVNLNSTCGFASTGLETHASVNPGDRGTSVEDVKNCVLDFPSETTLSTDCLGNSLRVRGQARLSATRTATGWITGDPTQPFVPTSRDGVTITLDANLDNFFVTSGDGSVAFTVDHGALGGSVTPRLALDTSTGACGLPTAVAALDNVRWSNADVQIRQGEKHLRAHLDSSSLSAINGRRNERENNLQGALRVSGTDITLPTAGISLDPAYNSASFAAAYTCDPNLVEVSNDGQCDFEPYLAQAAARLTVQLAAYTTQALDKDPTCGFLSVDNMLPSDLGALPGNLVTASWNATCALDAGRTRKNITENCLGTTYGFVGHADAIGTKTVTGAMALAYPPLKPTDRTSARVALHEVDLSNYAILERLDGALTDSPYLEVLHGRLSGVVHPITGEAADEPGAFYIPTTVVGFTDIQIENAEVVLWAGQKRFNLNLGRVDVDAFNGAYAGDTNAISGTIELNGNTYSVEPGLQPGYDQLKFDSTYTCTPNLKERVPPNGGR